jgi:hypothetical protein
MDTPGRTADLNNLSPPTGEVPTDAGKDESGGVAGRPPIEW